MERKRIIGRNAFLLLDGENPVAVDLEVGEYVASVI